MTSASVVGVRRILLWAVGALACVLVLTGLWLTFAYRPSAAQAWQEAVEVPSGWVRLTHRLTSFLLLPVLVALFAACLPAARRWAPAACLLLSAVALSFPGYLLPWDQLGLWAVTVGTNDIDGAWFAAFSRDVRFILIGGTEVTQGAYRLWLLVHAVGLTLVFAGALVVLARTSRDGAL